MRKRIFAVTALSLFTMYGVAREKPNIILIMADDLGWGDVGFNGNKQIKTPYMDKLAAQGVIFDRFYSGCSVSSPTRASVLTGRNPFRTGVFNANVGILRPEEETLPELLKKGGYITGHFGKWHLGTLTRNEKDANRGRPENKHLYNVPAEHGYDESFVTESKVPTFDPMLKPVENDGCFWDCLSEGQGKVTYGTYYWRHDGTKETENLSGDDSRIIMDRVLPFIEQAKASDTPFFSVVWFHTPHLPCVAGPGYAAMYPDVSLEERNYFGCITAMDDQIGRLVEFLKKKGMYENTIICFCSDNGPEVRTPGTAVHLRGKKRDLYEGGIRVPAFAVWPSMLPAGERTNHVCSTSDYLPTFVELLELDSPSYEIDGESLIPALERGEKRNKPIVFAYMQQGAVIEQQYKLYYSKGVYELYDITVDPSEKQDISISYQEEVARLSQILDKELERYKGSFDGKEYGTASVIRMKQQWHIIKTEKRQ